MAVFVLTALASWLAVVRNPELAYSLFDERVVEYENLRLEKQQGEYRGNFTFDLSDSPLVAVQIIGNNVRVAITAFALGSAGCVLGVFMLVFNGRMLGTLSGLVWNAGYFVGFYAIILTHGVLELSAICISAGGGLRLGWALLAPGQLLAAMRFAPAAPDAFGLLAGAILMLVVAGVIEAFVTPHFSAPVRWSVAGGTGLILALYLGLAGRGREVEASNRPGVPRCAERCAVCSKDKCPEPNPQPLPWKGRGKALGFKPLSPWGRGWGGVLSAGPQPPQGRLLQTPTTVRDLISPYSIPPNITSR